jgi:hypothetical protein
MHNEVLRKLDFLPVRFLEVPMSLAEIVYQTIKPLPEPMIREVLDFALFVQQQTEKKEWQNLMDGQSASLSDWDNAEDEVWNDAQTL